MLVIARRGRRRDDGPNALEMVVRISRPTEVIFSNIMLNGIEVGL